MKKTTIIHICSNLDRNHGGRERVLIDLVRSQVSMGYYVLTISTLAELRNLILLKKNSKNIIHIHGLWSLLTHLSILLAKKNNIPIIIQPHGMLMPLALKHKSLKKLIAMCLYQKSDINNANLLIATSSIEYESFRNLGFKNPIAIIPNGIEQINFNTSKKNKNSADKNFLFLSRIHPIKGLLNLIKAWSILNVDGWKLKIVGPNEDNYLDVIVNEISRCGVNQSVEIFPEVHGVEKEIFLRNADFFILPSISENFGIVILEALSYGIPVITTKGTPWSELESQGCGWWINIGIEPLVSAINEAISLPKYKLNLMKSNARNLAKKYLLENTVNQLAVSYQWVINSTNKPEYIYLDNLT